MAALRQENESKDCCNAIQILCELNSNQMFYFGTSSSSFWTNMSTVNFQLTLLSVSVYIPLLGNRPLFEPNKKCLSFASKI